MSSAGECITCPFNTGFEAEDGGILTVCGDPSQRCIDLRGRLVDQLAEWNRMAKLAEVAKKGIVPLDLLHEGDLLEIQSSAPGRSLSHKLERLMVIKVGEMLEGGLQAKVLKDTYNDEDDIDKRFYAIAKGEDVTIVGAFERTGKDSDSGGGGWTGVNVPGELHAGRYIGYRPENMEGMQGIKYGLYVQEISVVNGDKDIAMRLFNTDLDVHREAPPLEQ